MSKLTACGQQNVITFKKLYKINLILSQEKRKGDYTKPICKLGIVMRGDKKESKDAK